MHCPTCKSENIKVIDTLPGCNNNIFRRRRCVNCGSRFRTAEIIIDGNEELSAEYRKSPKYQRTLNSIIAHTKGSNK